MASQKANEALLTCTKYFWSLVSRVNKLTWVLHYRQLDTRMHLILSGFSKGEKQSWSVCTQPVCTDESSPFLVSNSNRKDWKTQTSSELFMMNVRRFFMMSATKIPNSFLEWIRNVSRYYRRNQKTFQESFLELLSPIPKKVTQFFAYRKSLGINGQRHNMVETIRSSATITWFL